MKVPAKASSSSARRPHYLTANVKSIDFTVSQPGNAALGFYTFYALTPQSTYCTSSSSGLTCSLQVQAAPGADTFVVNLYDSVEPGQGFIVATGSLAQTISAQASNVISITTDGVPTLANIGLGNPYPATGNATSTPITLNIADPDGDITVGSYHDMPEIALTGSDGLSGSDNVLFERRVWRRRATPRALRWVLLGRRTGHNWPAEPCIARQFKPGVVIALRQLGPTVGEHELCSRGRWAANNTHDDVLCHRFRSSTNARCDRQPRKRRPVRGCGMRRDCEYYGIEPDIHDHADRIDDVAKRADLSQQLCSRAASSSVTRAVITRSSPSSSDSRHTDQKKRG